MREILFKAKRTDNGEWVEGYYEKRIEWHRLYEWEYKKEEKHYICVNMVCSEDSYIDRIEVDSSTICQYTGLTDKNGQKIWENDIFKHYCKVNVGDPEYYEFCSVVWDELHCRFVNCNRIKNEYYFMNELCVYEVIGNTFDNPELLKGGADGV